MLACDFLDQGFAYCQGSGAIAGYFITKPWTCDERISWRYHSLLTQLLEPPVVWEGGDAALPRRSLACPLYNSGD